MKYSLLLALISTVSAQATAAAAAPAAAAATSGGGPARGQMFNVEIAGVMSASENGGRINNVGMIELENGGQRIVFTGDATKAAMATSAITAAAAMTLY